MWFGAWLMACAVVGNAREPEKTLVWVDTDNSAGVSISRDIDDALAIIQALASPELHVMGVSTVFGNAAESESSAATVELLHRLEATVSVHRGAESAGQTTNAGAAALRSALESAPRRVSVLALGALTNVAAAVKGLEDKVNEVVFVGGRRPGQLFRVGDFNEETLPDLNFEKDVDAARSLLASSVRLVLAPFELSSQVRLTEKHFSNSWLDEFAKPWLEFWRDTFRVDYFHPFDSLAVVAITHPRLLDCEELSACILQGPSDSVSEAFDAHREGGAVHGIGVPTKMYLHVQHSASCRPVLYCHTPRLPDTLDLILQRLSNHTSILASSLELHRRPLRLHAERRDGDDDRQRRTAELRR